MEYVTVRDVAVPAVGLGTWQTTGEECYETVSTALELGYRHVDTAQMYGNEREVGRAVADADVDRDDVLASSRESLDRLGTEYVDLLLLHWPNPLTVTTDRMSGASRVDV